MNETQSEPMTKVFKHNIEPAMNRFEACLKNYPIASFDTEYPGTLHPTYMNSSDDEFYSAMKANVESTKLIQCGITLFNAQGEIGGTWEINFSNFGDPWDNRNEISIEFLRRHGLDLEKIREQGVDMYGYGFFPKLLTALRSQKQVSFVTFQGAYDFAYFLSILNNGKLPETRGEFASQVVKVFGDVYDLKVMASFCDGLGGHLGLSKLAQLLKIARVGRAHHAGSDSLLTALAFIKLKKVYEDSMFAKGMLYGIGKRVTTITTAASELLLPSVGSIPLMSQQNLVSYPSSNLMYSTGYVPNYEHPPFYYLDPSGVPCVPWTFYNGMYLNQLDPSSTFAYPSQTPYAADYLAPVPNYYNNNPCYVVD